MQRDNVTVSEKRTSITVPRFEAIDILTIISLIIVGGLLVTGQPVPDFLIAIVGLGTGAKVYTESQLNASRENAKADGENYRITQPPD